MFCISLTRERQCGLRKRQCSAPTACPRSSAAVGPSPSCTLCFIPISCCRVLGLCIHLPLAWLVAGANILGSALLSVLCMEFIWANLQIIAFRARPETGTWTSITTPIYIWQLPCWHLFNGLRPSYSTLPYHLPHSHLPLLSLPWRSAAQVDFARWFFFMAFEWISPRQRTNWRHALRLCQDDNVKDFTRFGQRQRKFRLGFFYFNGGAGCMVKLSLVFVFRSSLKLIQLEWNS